MKQKIKPTRTKFAYNCMRTASGVGYIFTTKDERLKKGREQERSNIDGLKDILEP